jgi:hypothetical protein
VDSAGLELARRSLRQRLLEMLNVQACFLPPQQPVLIVQTWTGVVIHVHFVTIPIKTRQIKRILQESTDSGIGSMFLLDRELLPEADLRVTVPEWLMALHALTHERVYTFELNGEELKIGQLHFEPIGSTGDMAARYGPAPKLDRLRYIRTTIKPRYIRGDWQLADFGVDAFWKDPHLPRHGGPHTTHYHRPNPREYQWKSWSSGGGWDQPKAEEIPRPNLPARDKLQLAYALLEIEQGASKDDVRIAYRRLALFYHPDTSTLPKNDAEAKFRELNEAYEIIRAANKW